MSLENCHQNSQLSLRRVTSWRLTLGQAESWWDGWVALLASWWHRALIRHRLTFVTPGVPRLYAFHTHRHTDTQTHTHTHTHTHTLPESQLRLCHYDFCTTYQEIFVDTRRDLRNEHILLSYPFPLQILSTRFMSSFVLDVRDSTKEGTALALGN